MILKWNSSLALCAALLAGAVDAQGANWGGFNTIRNIWTAGASYDYIGSGALYVSKLVFCEILAQAD